SHSSQPVARREKSLLDRRSTKNQRESRNGFQALSAVPRRVDEILAGALLLFRSDDQFLQTLSSRQLGADQDGLVTRQPDGWLSRGGSKRVLSHGEPADGLPR